MKTVKKMLQKGFSTMQVVAGLAIAAVVTTGAAAVMLPAYNTMILNSAFEEIGVVASAARSVREYTGEYSSTNYDEFDDLVTNGFLPGTYTDGDGENRLGNDIDFAGSGTTASITYAFDDDEQCTNIQIRMDRVIGVSSSTCSGASLSITLN